MNSDSYIIKCYIETIGPRTEELKELQGLIIITQAAAGWLIALGGATLFGGIFSLVLTVVELQSTVRLVIGIIVSQCTRVYTFLYPSLQLYYNCI